MTIFIINLYAFSNIEKRIPLMRIELVFFTALWFLLVTMQIFVFRLFFFSSLFCLYSVTIFFFKFIFSYFTIFLLEYSNRIEDLQTRHTKLVSNPIDILDFFSFFQFSVSSNVVQRRMIVSVFNRNQKKKNIIF